MRYTRKTGEKMEAWLEKQFGLSAAGVTWQSEVRAGATTFLTMAYILIVNPKMMSGADITFMEYDTGLPFGDALFATAVASCVACLIMGLWANLPFALAPGMGLNAYFLYTVVFGMGVAWEVALGAVFIEGLLFMALSAGGVRTAMINAVPTDLKIATMSGIGMFLAIIGMEETGWVVDNPATLIDLDGTAAWTYQSGELWALIGLLAMGAMMARNVKGAFIYGIVGVTAVTWIMEAAGHGVLPGWGACNSAGVECFAPAIGDWLSMPSLPEESMGAALGAIGDAGTEVTDADGNVTWGGWGDFLIVIVAFLFVDIFDTSGTLYGVGRMAGKINEDDEIENANEAFMADAVGTTLGALLGTSTVTTYIESAAGIEEGGKTGLVAVTAGMLFLLGLFFSDLFIAIPAYATAPALILIGAMMMRGVGDIDWGSAEMAIPAFLTISIMPFTYSIADGIALGVISYVLMQLMMGKTEILENKILTGLAAVMALFYLGPGDQTTLEWILSNLN